jgi:hypothetical protein
MNINIVFEDLDGGFYPVAKKPADKSPTVSQNAGNNSYQVNGAGINGAFSRQFRGLGILKRVNTYLGKFIPPDVYGNKNVMVPLVDLCDDPETVDLMMYSVGPDMAVSDTFSKDNQEIIYSIYADAVTKILDYNKEAKYKIKCFRITLVSSKIFAPMCYDDEFKHNLISIILKALFDTMISDDNEFLDTILIQQDDEKDVLSTLETLNFSPEKIKSLNFATEDRDNMAEQVEFEDRVYPDDDSDNSDSSDGEEVVKKDKKRVYLKTQIEDITRTQIEHITSLILDDEGPEEDIK